MLCMLVVLLLLAIIALDGNTRDCWNSVFSALILIVSGLETHLGVVVVCFIPFIHHMEAVIDMARLIPLHRASV